MANNFYPFRDKQQDPPWGWCENCGQEIYMDFFHHYDGLLVCSECYKTLNSKPETITVNNTFELPDDF